MTTDAADVAASVPLPPYAHVPGANPRPDQSFFDGVEALLSSHDDAVWHYGLRLLNEGFCWEAHEILEPVWMSFAPNSRERFLVQAVIHLANGLLKLRMDRTKASSRLAGLAQDCTARAYPAGDASLMGLERKMLEHAIAALQAGEQAVRLDLSQCG